MSWFAINPPMIPPIKNPENEDRARAAYLLNVYLKVYSIIFRIIKGKMTI